VPRLYYTSETMKPDKLVKQASRLAEPFLHYEGREVSTERLEPRCPTGVKNKQHAQNILDAREGVLSRLQEKLYAQDRWGGFGRPPGSGRRRKGWRGQARYVRRESAGMRRSPFKTPSNEELNHDYLWRAHKCIPERGKIGIFNRSYYEEVLIVRVHPTLLRAESCPTNRSRSTPGNSATRTSTRSKST